MFSKILRYYRYVWYLIKIYLYEKPRGLDFHQRDLKLQRNTQGSNNGYAVTPTSHIKQIFDAIDVKNNNCFLDVGCGKGLVITQATKYPFKKITGIDIVPHLIETAHKNIDVLNLQDRVQVCVTDASCFENYSDYDCIFLFNPFSEEIMEKTMQKIVESLETSPRNLCIVYCAPRDEHLILQTGRFQLTQELHCFLKNFDTHIFRSIC